MSDVLVESGYKDIRQIAGNGKCCIAQMIFTHAILSGVDCWGYRDRWCYETYDQAKSALDAWDGAGEPQGWIRHPPSGRHRPGGDASKEFINP